MENTNKEMPLEKAKETLNHIRSMLFELPTGSPEWHCQMGNKRFLENYILQNFGIEGFVTIVPQ